MKRWTFRLLFLLVALYVALCAAMFAGQRALLYKPQPRQVTDPAATLKLPVDGAELVVTVRPHAGPKAIVYFGGNAEDVSRSLPDYAAWFPDHAIYLLHYRGYGGSTGAPTEVDNHADARALLRHVQASHGDITVIGRSLGTGVAVRVASEQKVTRLVLVTPYDSIAEIAAAIYWYVPTRLLLRDTYDSARLAPTVKVPTTVIVADHDLVIPRSSTDRLMKRFTPGIARLVEIPDADHGSILRRPGYREALQSAP